MAVMLSEELRTVLPMFLILLTVNFKFRNRFTNSKGPIKRAGNVCRDFQDLKSPGSCLKQNLKSGNKIMKRLVTVKDIRRPVIKGLVQYQHPSVQPVKKKNG